MTTLFITLLLMQSSLLLPPRAAIENPAAVSQIPAKLRKDFDKLWSRFLTAKADTQLTKDLDNLVKKQKTFDSALTIEGYIELYRGNDSAAALKFQQALALNSSNRIAAYYLAELAYAHEDYAQANALYSRLLSIDKTRTDVEPKRQRALLLAIENLLRSAARAEGDNQFSEAEQLYRRAMTILPKDPTLHLRLADLLVKENKVDEAAAERKTAEDLTPRTTVITRSNAGLKTDDLEDLGRWGKDIGVFREIRNAQTATREQVAAIIVKYFPQVTERQQTPQIITDIESSWARTEIQTVVDAELMDCFPNHTFEPSALMTRGEFATALARLIRMLSLSASTTPPASTPDVAPTNTQYAEIQLVLGYRLMALQDSGAFGVSENLPGQEAVRAAAGLLRTFQQAQH